MYVYRGAEGAPVFVWLPEAFNNLMRIAILRCTGICLPREITTYRRRMPIVDVKKAGLPALI